MWFLRLICPITHINHFFNTWAITQCNQIKTSATNNYKWQKNKPFNKTEKNVTQKMSFFQLIQNIVFPQLSRSFTVFHALWLHIILGPVGHALTWDMKLGPRQCPLVTWKGEPLGPSMNSTCLPPPPPHGTAMNNLYSLFTKVHVLVSPHNTAWL